MKGRAPMMHGRCLGFHRQRLDLGLHLLALAQDLGEVAERFREVAAGLRLDGDDDREEVDFLAAACG